MDSGNELSDEQTDRVFHALAAATRRDILRRTIEREQSVSALAADYDMSFAAVQKHVAVLEAAELVVKRAEGRERLVRADPAMIARARALLARYEELWRARIGRLDAILAEPSAPPTPPTDQHGTRENDTREGE
jgi:DNA-binding transcriptional ArsR family regulator